MDGDDTALQRMADEERTAEAARARARERWLRQQATESASLAGLLLVAAEADAELVVRTASGRAHRGTVRTVARDFCGLRTRDASEVFVPLGAVAGLQLMDATTLTEVTDDREPPLDLLFVELLAQEVATTPRVGVVVHGDPDRVVGELEVVGADLLGLRIDGGPRALRYMALAAVTELSFL
jgi:hypothetical protein